MLSVLTYELQLNMSSYAASNSEKTIDNYLDIFIDSELDKGGKSHGIYLDEFSYRFINWLNKRSCIVHTNINIVKQYLVKNNINVYNDTIKQYKWKVKTKFDNYIKINDMFSCCSSLSESR